jgi:hypothetical protein
MAEINFIAQNVVGVPAGTPTTAGDFSFVEMTKQA